MKIITNALSGIRTYDQDPRPWPRGHCDQHLYSSQTYILNCSCSWLRTTLRRMVGAVPWLRRLVAVLSPRSTRFVPGSMHVGFLVEEVTLGQVSHRVLVFPCQYHSTEVLHTHVSSGGWTICPLLVAVQGRKMSTHKNQSNQDVWWRWCTVLSVLSLSTWMETSE
jgi:hypothetical protein